MVAYHQFVSWVESQDSEERGQAAHLAAMAYLAHRGPADEHAALYAALIGFLDDPSVKVRAALAYGLLHADTAPRPILLALLQDSAIISRAVAQYSPALIEVDLIALVRQAEPDLLISVCLRDRLTLRLCEALVARGNAEVTLKIVQRADAPLGAATLTRLAEDAGDARLRGALLARKDLPARARLRLVHAVAEALRSARVVAGAVAPLRLEKILRDATDAAMTAIGDREAALPGNAYAAEMVQEDRVSTRVMLHALCNGHVLFFSDCVAELSGVSRNKVFTLLESGSRPALNALLARCGLGPDIGNLIARLVLHAREADLADDVAARHFVVTALTEELIIEHDGAIPPALEDAFSYLCEQNVALARHAARGVMAAFAGAPEGERDLPVVTQEDRLALPAA